MRLKQHPFSLCCISPRSCTGVYRDSLPTEMMDYAKPDTSISQLEEKSDSLDKAKVKHPGLCVKVHISALVTITEHLHVCQVFKRLEHPPLYVFNFYSFYASRKREKTSY